jgi:hypothetical protein
MLQLPQCIYLVLPLELLSLTFFILTRVSVTHDRPALNNMYITVLRELRTSRGITASSIHDFGQTFWTSLLNVSQMFIRHVNCMLSPERRATFKTFKRKSNHSNNASHLGNDNFSQFMTCWLRPAWFHSTGNVLVALTELTVQVYNDACSISTTRRTRPDQRSPSAPSCPEY